MFLSGYSNVRRLIDIVNQGYGEILSFIFVMAIEPTIFICEGRADRYGWFSQLGGEIKSVLVAHLLLNCCMVFCYVLRTICYM